MEEMLPFKVPVPVWPMAHTNPPISQKMLPIRVVLSLYLLQDTSLKPGGWRVD